MTAGGARAISVIIPVYFNADSLPALYAALQDVETTLASRGLRLELIFVDDGSEDESFAELMRIKAARPATRVIRLTRNFGTVPAIRTGLRYVTGDAFAFLSADLQDPPSLVTSLADRWLGGSRFVIAERMNRHDPLMSRILSRAYYFVVRKLVLPGYPAGGFDVALMDRVMLAPLRDSAKSAFLPLLAYWLGYKPAVIQYVREPRRHGKSRWTLGKRVRAFVDVVLGFSVTPIRAISALGALVSLASFAYGTLVAVARMFDYIPVAGYSTLVALVTFLLGLIICMLGLIGEYLWRIFDEGNRRPDAVVDEEH